MIHSKFNGRKTFALVHPQINGRYFEDALRWCSFYEMSLPLPTSDQDTNVLTSLFLKDDDYSENYGARAFIAATNSNDKKEWRNIYTGESLSKHWSNKKEPYAKWTMKNGPDYEDMYENHFDFMEEDFRIPAEEKIAEIWSNKGRWNDISVIDKSPRSLICVKDTNKGPGTGTAANLTSVVAEVGEFLCENGLSRCDPSTLCTKADASQLQACEENRYECLGWSRNLYMYSCKCPTFNWKNVTYDPVSESPELSPLAPENLRKINFYGWGKCQYQINGLNTQPFVYRGEQKFYHVTRYPADFYETVDYCARHGMQLPVPSTMRDLGDLAAIGKLWGQSSWIHQYFLGYKRSENGTWRNIYTNAKMTIGKNQYWELDESGYEFAILNQYRPNMIFNDRRTGAGFTVCVPPDSEPSNDFCSYYFKECIWWQSDMNASCPSGICQCTSGSINNGTGCHDVSVDTNEETVSKASIQVDHWLLSLIDNLKNIFKTSRGVKPDKKFQIYGE